MAAEEALMRNSLLTLLMAAVFTAPASALTITLTPLVVGQNSLPTLVTTCASPNVPAQVAGEAFFEMPSIAAVQGVSGTSTLKIQLDSKGNMTSSSLYNSSGNVWLDAATQRSARLTRFSPEMQNCQRIGGAYLYAVQY
jgi:TonB family protein